MQSNVIVGNLEEAVKLTKEKVTIHELINFDKIPANPVKVSVVVPVCNVEMYLEECLQSIVDQTLADIEIICVNDGSKDSSLDILKKFAASDSRVKIINKDNAGYGHTMNIGMDMAQGEYIGIVESDDYVDLHMYEDLYNIAVEKNLDLIKADFNRFKVFDGQVVCDYYELTSDHPELYNKVLDLNTCLDPYKMVMNTWSGIYKTSFLRENVIRHNETPGASYQDNGFWYQTFSNARRAYFVNKPYYMNRRDNPNSSVFSKAKAFCMCDEYEYIRNIIDSDPEKHGHLVGMYHARKYGNYMFTLNRVGAEFKIPFLRRFHDEFCEAIEKGELDRSLFSEKDLAGLDNIVRDDYIEYYTQVCLEKLDWNREKLKEVEAELNAIVNPERIDISIIVPVYNTANYLVKCMDSLVNQTYKNIEIICVNDGSTDASAAILAKYSSKDRRIRVITTENSGVSHARNVGIENAHGTYIMFVDSDDFLERNACEILIKNVINTNADVVIFGGSSTTGLSWVERRLTTKAAMYKGDTTNVLFEVPASKPFIWNKLYRTSVIRENNMSFDESFAICEDQLWCFELFRKTETVQVIPDKLYHYFTAERAGSAMAHFRKKPELLIENHLRMAEAVREQWDDQGILADYEKEFGEWVVPFISDVLRRLPMNYKLSSYKRFVESFGDYIDIAAASENDYVRECAEFVDRIKEYKGDVKVSIIIPVFNSEDYLAECMSSVCEQTMLDIEIIPVDDGSEDSSLAILNEFAAKDSRIKILTQNNMYAGVARNNGLSVAKGDYLLFLDSDDFFSSKMVEELYKTITATDSDICLCDGRHYHNSDGKFIDVHFLLNKELLPETVPFSYKDVSDAFYSISNSCVWNKMMKREFVEKNGLQFSCTRTANDVYFVNLALASAEKITYTDEKLVFYRVGMTTNLQTIKKDVPLDFYDEYIRLKESLIASGKYEELARSLDSIVFSNIRYHLTTIASPSGFCKIYDKFVGDAMTDFNFNKALTDNNYFVAPWMNVEFKKLVDEDSVTFLFNRFKTQTSLQEELDKVKQKLEWNRKQREEVQKKYDDLAAEKSKSDRKANRRGAAAEKLRVQVEQLEAELKKVNDELAKANRALRRAKNESNDIRKSVSYRIGRFFTWLPRKIKGLFAK